MAANGRAAIRPVERTRLRDAGGWPTHDGGRTRHDLLFRAAALFEPTPSDELVLRSHVRLCVDLRASFEVAASGAGAFADAGLPVHRVPVVEAEDATAYLARLSTHHGPGAGLDATYRFLLDEGAPAFARAVGLLAGGLPAAVCCTTGANRTGLLTALVLRVAGVPDAHIGADWMAGLPTARTPAPIASALAYLDERWGGAQRYLLAAGACPGDIAALRKALTVPPESPPLAVGTVRESGALT